MLRMSEVLGTYTKHFRSWICICTIRVTMLCGQGAFLVIIAATLVRTDLDVLNKSLSDILSGGSCSTVSCSEKVFVHNHVMLH